ncbi:MULTISPECIES: helix-turn-helix domain-containing protein [unclassified Brevundimonas]|uniref:helix-turn-helix domain-containing protein n=1 Tax=unclassified Brevundimonas TaxID=2622653 RepID=UPI002005AFDF|nr:MULTISPECIES: AraC family transcriptional regulator [unclassified Brevundimonas]MCK6104150.1 AraC family transcriptional regulator [Brevundimonas sp. EYE_349]
MIIGSIDVAIRAGAAVTILLLGWLMLGHRRRLGLPAILFAPLAACVAGFVVGNTPLTTMSPGGSVGAMANMLSGFTVVFLWWFCLSCFDSRFRLKGGVLGVGLAWGLIAAMDRGLLGKALAQTSWSVVLVPLGFAIVGHMVWRLLAERQGDLIQRRHDARIMVAVLLGGMLCVDLTADVLFGFAWRPLAFAMGQNLAVLAFGLWLAGRLLSVRSDVLTFGAADRTPPRSAPDRDDALHRRLRGLMETERVFLDADLTFAAFVARMGAPERTVRNLINRELGHDHFRSFLNHYRVAEARRLLGAQARADDKLIAVAQDSGFASLASFNRAFRAIEGCAPSQYRAAARQAEVPTAPDVARF